VILEADESRQQTGDLIAVTKQRRGPDYGQGNVKAHPCFGLARRSVRLFCFVCYGEISGALCPPIVFLVSSKSSLLGGVHGFYFVVFRFTV